MEKIIQKKKRVYSFLNDNDIQHQLMWIQKGTLYSWCCYSVCERRTDDYNTRGLGNIHVHELISVPSYTCIVYVDRSL